MNHVSLRLTCYTLYKHKVWFAVIGDKIAVPRKTKLFLAMHNKLN